MAERYAMKESVRMFEKGTDKALTVDVAGLQALSVVTDEVAGLARRNRRSSGGRKVVCLITLNNSANDVGILNILGGFGL